MFNLFGRKKDKVKINDVVWMTTQAKWEAIRNRMLENPNTIVLCWFPETLEAILAFCRSSVEAPENQVLLVREYSSHRALNALLFAEHYPLAAKEDEFYKNTGLTTVQVFSALDEPFFTLFGAGNIAGLMRRLGMDESESVSHKMIAASIRNAQEKVAEKVSYEHSALSAADWFRKNLPPSL